MCVKGKIAFVFNGAFYSKIESLVLGSSLSVPLCDIHMHCFEEKIFSVYKFPHWFENVDGTFFLVPSNIVFSSLLFSINSIDCCFQFVFKIKNDNSHSFLDGLNFKYIDWILTTLFRKFFSESSFLHAPSNQLPQEKIAAFYIYVYRALQHIVLMLLIFPVNLIT